MQEAWAEMEKDNDPGELWNEFKDSFDELWQKLKKVLENVISQYRQVSA